MKMKKILVLPILVIMLVMLPLFTNVNAIEQLTDKVVTSGEGLYADPTVPGRYVFRGANPDNYIMFNGELWRIMAIEPDGKVKIARIMRDDFIEAIFEHGGTGDTFDEGSNNPRTLPGPNGESTFCQGSGGCNLWAGKGTMLQADGTTPVEFIYREGLGNFYIPEGDATLNTYLNGPYYNTLNEDKTCMVDNLYNVGFLSAETTSLQEAVNSEKTYTWHGKIGLPTVTDYIKASLDNSCQGGQILDWQCYATNYMNTGFVYWALTPDAHSVLTPGGQYEWVVGNGMSPSMFTYFGSGAVPVVHLSSLTSLTGSGTDMDPYVIEACPGKAPVTPEPEDKSEEVNVPSTDEFIPLIISLSALVLIIIGSIGYYFINKRKRA